MCIYISPFTPLSDPFTPFGDPFTPFRAKRSALREASDGDGERHPLYPCTPYTRGGAFRVALRRAFFGYKGR
eukprot:2907816-Heterocapsa_arctica.AAC.1